MTANPISVALRDALDLLESLAEELSNEASLTLFAGRQSVAFHVWHVARRIDEAQANAGNQPQIWIARGLREDWHLTDADLGGRETGSGLTESSLVSIGLPT